MYSPISYSYVFLAILYMVWYFIFSAESSFFHSRPNALACSDNDKSNVRHSSTWVVLHQFRLVVLLKHYVAPWRLLRDIWILLLHFVLRLLGFRWLLRHLSLSWFLLCLIHCRRLLHLEGLNHVVHIERLTDLCLLFLIVLAGRLFMDFFVSWRVIIILLLGCVEICSDGLSC